MTTELPTPLVPAEVDLRGYDFMPFFGDALDRSDFNKTTDDTAWRFGVMLWWEAWAKQVPAASLPDDDALLARACGLGRDLNTFRKIKAAALHGFIKCDDGRLYHKFLAGHAIEAYEGRIKQQMKTTGARIAGLKKRLNDAVTDAEKQHIEGQIHKLSQGLSQAVSQAVNRSVTGSVTGKSPPHQNPLSQQPQREGERQGEGQGQGELNKNNTSGKPDHVAQAVEILTFLNAKAGKNFQPVTGNLKFIAARLRAGATVEQCRQVIAKKVRDWSGNETMQPYLRPETLFNETKFAQYQGELVPVPPPADEVPA